MADTLYPDTEDEMVPRIETIGTADAPNPIDFESLVETLAADDEDGSHTEFHPSVFHPSQVGYHPWLIYVKKLGLDDTSDLAGTFHVGEMIHREIQNELARRPGITPSEQIEVPVEFEDDGLTFLGHADLYDPDARIVYDIKSRANWYNFDPPVDRHVDQLHTYMRGLGVEHGQVIYVSKKDLEVRTWPEGAPFTFDEQRWAEITARCKRVRDAIVDNGFATSEDEIPFEKPGDDHEQSYFVESTELDFSSVVK